MDDSRREAPHLTPHSSSHQAQDQIIVLPTPSDEAVVEAVYAVKVAAPHGHVAGLRSTPRLLGTAPDRPKGERQERCETVHPLGQPSAPPREQRPILRAEIIGKHALRELPGQHDPVAHDEMPTLRQPPVRGHVVLTRDAVAVEEDAVVALAGQDGLVADFGGTETAVLVPDVRSGYAGGFDDSARPLV